MRITTKENDIESILYSEKQIAAMVETLGEKLTEDQLDAALDVTTMIGQYK